MIKTICSLFVQFSFLPQVIWAASLYLKLAANSYVLIAPRLHMAFFTLFLGIVVIAVLTSVRRFYLIRFLLLGAYTALLITVIPFEFRHAENIVRNEALMFAAFGAIMTALNMTALYIYKNVGAHSPQKGENYE